MVFRLAVDGEKHDIEIVRRRPHLTLRIDGREHEVSIVGTLGDGRQTVEIGGTTVAFARAQAGDRAVVRLNGRTFEAAIVDPFAESADAGGGHDEIRAPMPGVVVSVQKKPGDAVARGETIVTIESMKLQMTLVAPRDGCIAALLRSEGETFEKDEVVARLEATTEGP